MAGLLDMFDNGDAQLGLGLLAAAAPRSDGAGFGTRLLEGVNHAQSWKQQQKKNKLMDLQQQEAEIKLAEAQRAADIQKWTLENAPKFFRPSVPAQPAQFQDVPQVPQAAPAIANPMGIDPAQTRQLPPVQQLVSPAVQASPASFDQRGFIESYAQKDPLGALQYLTKDNAPIKLGAGDVLLDKNTYKPLFTAPAKPEKDDSKITQYEYAQKNGYKGTFEQFVTLGPALMAAAAAPMRNAQIAGMEAENDYKLPPPRNTQKPAAPMVGQVVQGYKFKGGNPADQRNWEKQ